MARYEKDFMGIPGEPRDNRGEDPNFRNGYRGMRMDAGAAQGAYGLYRMRHADDLGTMGGFYGSYDRGEDPRLLRRYNAIDDGGVRDTRYDRKLLGGFNANSERLRDEGRGRDSHELRALQKRSEMPDAHAGQRFDYSNRGYSTGGYSDGWAYGPMRGAPRSKPTRRR